MKMGQSGRWTGRIRPFYGSMATYWNEMGIGFRGGHIGLLQRHSSCTQYKLTGAIADFSMEIARESEMQTHNGGLSMFAGNTVRLRYLMPIAIYR